MKIKFLMYLFLSLSLDLQAKMVEPSWNLINLQTSAKAYKAEQKYIKDILQKEDLKITLLTKYTKKLPQARDTANDRTKCLFKIRNEATTQAYENELNKGIYNNLNIQEIKKNADQAHNTAFKIPLVAEDAAKKGKDWQNNNQIKEILKIACDNAIKSINQKKPQIYRIKIVEYSDILTPEEKKLLDLKPTYDYLSWPQSIQKLKLIIQNLNNYKQL